MPDKNSPDFSTTEPLNTAMRCGIFTNAKGEILIIHDQEIKGSVQWIEYHKDNNQIFLIHENGTSQSLGLPVDNKMQGNMLHGIEVTLAYLKDKKVISSQKVSLVIQDY
jgi:hypothetical protein